MRVTIDVASISVVASFISMLLAFFAIWYMRNVEKRTGDLLNRFSEYFGDIRAKTSELAQMWRRLFKPALYPSRRPRKKRRHEKRERRRSLGIWRI